MPCLNKDELMCIHGFDAMAELTKIISEEILMDIQAETLLSFSRPEQLFTVNQAESKKVYLSFVKEWHPDTNKDPKSGVVLSHIVSLWKAAEEKYVSGVWGFEGLVPDTVLLPMQRGKKIPYLKHFSFESGDCYITENSVAYTYHSIPFKGIPKFTFPNEKIRENVSKYLPINHTGVGDKIWITKDPELVQLREVFEHYGRQIDPRHVAWMISSLLDLSCYLEVVQICCPEISMDTLWIHPKGHYATLIGGWNYSCKIGDPLKYVSKRTNKLLPFSVKRDKLAISKIHIDLIKGLTQELLAETENIPDPLKTWLKQPSKNSAIETYKEWPKVLEKAFGSKKYVELTYPRK